MVCRFFCCSCFLLKKKKSKIHSIQSLTHIHLHILIYRMQCWHCGTGMMWAWDLQFQVHVKHSCFTGDWSNYLPLFFSWAVSQGEDIGYLHKWKLLQWSQTDYTLNCCRNLEIRTQRKMHHVVHMKSLLMLGHNLKKCNTSNLYFKKPRRVKCFLQAYSIILQGFGY